MSWHQTNCVVILPFKLDSDFTASSSHIELEETKTIEHAMMKTTVVISRERGKATDNEQVTLKVSLASSKTITSKSDMSLIVISEL